MAAFFLEIFLSLVSFSALTELSFSRRMSSMWQGEDMYGFTRPWALYVLRRCLIALLTWMWSMTRLSTSRPLVSALLSAFLRSPCRNSADLTGHLPCPAGSAAVIQ